MRIRGKDYLTLKDAAEFLDVSSNTVSGYIRRGIIPRPPTEKYGTRRVYVFTPKSLAAAQKHVDEYARTKVARFLDR